MGRAQANDPFQGLPFRVQVATDAPNLAFLKTKFDEAGFTAVTTPEYTIDAIEYKEGNMTFTHKLPGNPTVAECTMSKGVMRGYTAFFDWVYKNIIMYKEYRVTLLIKHYHREELAALGQTLDSPRDLDNVVPAREYILYEAWALRNKSAGDLDGTAPDTSIQELDVAYERFDIIDNT